MTANPVAALSVRGLSVSYGGRVVLRDVDLEVPAGRLSAIVGPNGAGKSTLLKAALGLVPLARGEVRLLGEPLARVRRRIAYVPQRDAVTPHFPITAVEVVEMGRYPHRGWFRRLRPVDDDSVALAMERTGVASLGDEPFDELSGGQRQRVLLARALAQEADLLVLDEPFAAVDARTEHALLDLLAELTVGEGRSVLAVHHELRTVADRFDHAALLAGSLIAAGPVEQVLIPARLERAYGLAPLAGSPERDRDATREAARGVPR